MIPLWLDGQSPIIAFTGLKGSGKSAAAKALMPWGFTVHSFAKPIKAMMRALAVLDTAMQTDTKELPHPVLCGKSPRYVMQQLGTELGRAIVGTELWINVWQETRPPGPVVIDDCRFANEADYIRSRGGIVIRIIRPGIVNSDLHESEAGQSQIDPDDTLFNIGDERTFSIMVRETVQRALGA